MEISKFCLCCLRGPADRDMKMPYNNFGKTEIYSDMLKECFEIHSTKLLLDDECRICEACVGCLRDAYNFKLRVLQSHAELQRLLDKEHVVKEEECSLKSELSKNDEELIEEECSLKSELSENDEELIDFSKDVKLELPDPLPSAETSFKEFEAMIDTEIQTSDVCKEPTIEYEFEQASYPKPKKHTPGIRNKCTACGLHFTSKALLARHKLIHNTCATCRKQFKNLKLHRFRPRYVCDLCNEEFCQRIELNRHRQRVHDEQHSQNRLLTCDICDAQFQRKHLLIAHIGKHQGRRHFSCRLCLKRFWDRRGLHLHQKRHNQGKIYKCECGKTYTYRPNLENHIKTHIKPYSCNVCRKEFSALCKLRRHEAVHTGDRPYSCESCQKSFRHQHHLDNHMHTHTGERPHCCEVCGKRFSKRYTLTTHQLTHVKGNYSCELCAKSYSTKEGLRQHRRSHLKMKVKSEKISKKVKKNKSKIQKNTEEIS